MNPREVIEERTKNVLGVWSNARGKWDFAPSLTKMSSQAAHEYANRFLIELIQNAYDAHPPERRDGVIHILLAEDEGDYGTLYIANKGRAFTARNFAAICEIAKSDKLPGAGIGNKGLGFRSVLQICQSPRVYSVSPENGERDKGFCFGFATDADLKERVKDPADLEAVKREISRFFMPVPLVAQGATVESFFDAGFVTVIALPLHKETSKTAVVKQMDLLRGSEAPVLLFLDRIERLVIENGRGTDGHTRTDLTRSVEPSVVADVIPNAQVERVKLGDQGDYIVISRAANRIELDRAIRASIEADQLDEEYARWECEARVSLAVRLDEGRPCFRLYTFLPMGVDAKSPFAGHLNAPFVTKLARTELNYEVPLNAYFLRVAGELCAAALIGLQGGAGALVPITACVDLLTWVSPFHLKLIEGFTSLKRGIQQEALVPIWALSTGNKWGRVGRVILWGGEGNVFSSNTLASVCAAEIASNDIRGDREGRLRSFLILLGNRATADSGKISEWAECIAEHLHTGRVEIKKWDAFYDELVKLLPLGGESLAGRKILLDSTGALRAGKARGGGERGCHVPDMFFPPVREKSEEEEEVAEEGVVAEMPASLSQYVCFAHNDLTWYSRGEGRQKRTPAREFLQKAGLVRPYRTENLIELLSRIVEEATSDEIRRDALKYAYRLQKAARSVELLGLEKKVFFVPTQSGWVRAGEAFFSADWRDTIGRKLEQLIHETRALSGDMAPIASHLLLPPDSEYFTPADPVGWTKFLRLIGVRDGLWPVEIKKDILAIPGRDVSPVRLAELLGLDGECKTRWCTINRGRRCAYPNTTYVIDGVFYRLPGQGAHDQFTAAAKHVYADLIMHGLGMWEEKHLRTIVHIPRYRNDDPNEWTSPLGAFLQEVAWVPVPDMTRGSGNTFATLREAWHYTENDGESCPPFVSVIPRSFRRMIDNSEVCYKRLRKFGMPVFNEASDAAKRIVLLGQMLADDQIDGIFMRRYADVYWGAWEDAIKGSLGNPFAGLERTGKLVVRRGDALEAINAVQSGEGEAAETVYVADKDDSVTRQLLRELRKCMFECRPESGAEAAGILDEVLGPGRVKRYSETHIGILADQIEVKEIAGAELLIKDERGWLKDLLALTIDQHSQLTSQRSEKAQSEMQQRLGRLRVVWADRVDLVFDGIPCFAD